VDASLTFGLASRHFIHWTRQSIPGQRMGSKLSAGQLSVPQELERVILTISKYQHLAPGAIY